MVADTILRIIVWFVVKLISVVYIPINLYRRCFVGRKKVCPPIKNDLLLLSAAALAEKIRKKQVTSETVIRSYIERISEVNPLINAVVENRFEEAIEDSKWVETILNSSMDEKEIEEKFPLLGVPITVKDSIAVEGLDHSAGVLLKQKKAIKDADTVATVKLAGAIPLLVSNTPEFCLNWETFNNLIGMTKNPYDLRRTVGGSSGGEGALLASGCSVIGLGSDIAGSLRLPMHFCGVCGHKPTPGVISIDGHYPSSTDENWPNVFHIGPTARYASDLKRLFEVLAKPSFAKKDLKDPIDLKKLKVYYATGIDNNWLVSRSCDSTVQAVQKVVAYLDGKTEICNSIKLDKNVLKFAAEHAFLNLLLLDDVDNLFKGNGKGAHFELLKFLFCSSKAVISSICYGLLRWWLFVIPKKYRKKNAEDIKAMKDELLQLLDDHSVLILPTFRSSAPFHKSYMNSLFDYGQCAIFNALGLPVTVVPVARDTNGMPIGIQIVGSPYSDRLCLAVGEELERAFGGWRPPSDNAS